MDILRRSLLTGAMACLAAPAGASGAFPYGARRAIAYGNGWIPHRSRPQYGDVGDFLPEFHKMAREFYPIRVLITAIQDLLRANQAKRYIKTFLERFGALSKFIGLNGKKILLFSGK